MFPNQVTVSYQVTVFIVNDLFGYNSPEMVHNKGKITISTTRWIPYEKHNKTVKIQ